MSNLLEQLVWEAGVYQIEDSDVSSGGEDGLFNAQPKALANRTAWLRQRVESELQDLIMVSDRGNINHMVWIPRFTLPANAIGPGLPATNLDLGGFAVDKYLCRHRPPARLRRA